MLVNELVMDRRPVHGSCDITSKKEKKIQCAMDRRAGASWQAVMKHCDLEFGRLRAAWPAELDGFLERMEGGFKFNKTPLLFFA